MNHQLQSPESWAALLWKDASSRWSSRSGQDKSYRRHVIHPFLAGFLKTHFKKGGLRIIDLGCGDCVLLDDPEIAELIQPSGMYLGIDISRGLLDRARNRRNEANIIFFQENLSNPSLHGQVTQYGAIWDCFVSIFVIQEITCIEGFMKNCSALLEQSHIAVIITVHPGFAEWLKEQGHIKTADELIHLKTSEHFWKWAGGYPIVDEPEGVFYLPHFQRGVDDYLDVMKSFGIIVENVIDLPDKKRELPALVKKGVSPFKYFEGNIYWPRIGAEPSAVAFIIRKG